MNTAITTSRPTEHSIESSENGTAATLTRIVRFLAVVRMRKGILFAAMLIAGVLGGLYYATAARMYESKARVFVLQMGSNVLEEAMQNSGGIRENMANYQGIITSDAVLNEVVGKLPKEHRGDFKGKPRDKWVPILRSNLAVNAPRRTNLIDIRYRSRDPQTAAVIVGHVVRDYLELMREIHKSSAISDVELMTRERERLDKNIKTINEELLGLRQQMKIISGPDNENINPAVVRLLALNKDLIDAMTRTRESRATLAGIKKALAAGEDIQQYARQLFEQVGEQWIGKTLLLSQQDEYFVNRTKQQMINDQVELRALSGDLGPNHPRILKLVARIRDRQEFLDNRFVIASREMQKLATSQLAPVVLETAIARLQIAVSREQLLREDFERENKTVSEHEFLMGRIRFLKANLGQDREFAKLIGQRISQTDLNSERSGLRTRIVSQPKVAKVPVLPRLMVVALLTLICGIGGGLGVIYVLDAFDDRFRTPEELRIQLGVPVLAMIGELPSNDRRGTAAIRICAEPNGPETEPFRTLRTQLSFSEHPTQRLVVTSTEPGDGKTTVLVNLAAAYAQSGKRTLLIDADMRRPGLTSLLDLKGTNGLSQVLRDKQPIAESCTANLHASDIENLHVLPSGPRPVDPAELLHGDRFSELLAWAESVYDQVLVDAPPAIAVSDPAIIGRLVDGVLLVVRPEKNRRRMVIRAFESFAAVRAEVLGTVINHVSGEAAGDYYGYGYGQAYDYSSHDDDTAAATAAAITVATDDDDLAGTELDREAA